jgi:hypothetical protein
MDRVAQKEAATVVTGVMAATVVAVAVALEASLTVFTLSRALILNNTVIPLCKAVLAMVDPAAARQQKRTLLEMPVKQVQAAC